MEPLYIIIFFSFIHRNSPNFSWYLIFVILWLQSIIKLFNNRWYLRMSVSHSILWIYCTWNMCLPHFQEDIVLVMCLHSLKCYNKIHHNYNPLFDTFTTYNCIDIDLYTFQSIESLNLLSQSRCSVFILFWYWL